MSSHKSDLSTLVDPQELSREALRTLIGLTEKPSLKLVDWERLGKPHADRVVATMVVPMTQAGQVMQEALTISGLRTKIKGFPIGIPVIDAVRLEIEATAG